VSGRGGGFENAHAGAAFDDLEALVCRIEDRLVDQEGPALPGAVRLPAQADTYVDALVAAVDPVLRILGVVVEYRSASEGEDPVRKLAREARLGGTIGPAKIGYINVKEEFDGRMISAVAFDPERAALIRHGFELYATGEYTVKQLEQAMGRSA
jgi:hypothetical protein